MTGKRASKLEGQYIQLHTGKEDDGQNPEEKNIRLIWCYPLAGQRSPWLVYRIFDNRGWQSLVGHSFIEQIYPEPYNKLR